MDEPEENIRLHLVTPNYGSESQAPTQIMEADNPSDEENEHNMQEAESKYIIPELSEDSDRLLDADTEPLDPNHDSMTMDDPDEPSEMEADDGENVEEDASDLEDKIPLSENEGLSDGEVKTPLGPMGTDDRVSLLETEFKRSKNRMDGFSQELKILLVEVNIVCDWITENFGVELIDKASQLFKHIHDFDEIEELSQTLSLLKKGKRNVRRSARRKPVKPKKKAMQPAKKKRGRGRPRKKETEDSEETSPEEEQEVDDFFDPPECVLNTDVEEEFFKTEAKPKRKRVRKRTPKKVVKKEGEAAEGEEEAEVKDECDKEAETEEGEPKKRKKWKAPQRSLQCEECGKILKADSSLRWHMLMHADLRPVECLEPGCGKSFRDKSKLAQHMKIHNGEKSEKCRYCDRGFLRKKDLIVHERTHTGEKPFSCPNCPKTFNIKDHLTIHLRVHTGERPYKCLVCEKAFSQANSLRIHKKIHLKQAGEHVPPPRKPRAPRKSKHVVTIQEHHHSPSSVSTHQSTIERVDLEDPKAMNLHDDGTGQGMDTPSPGDNAESHAIVQSLFQVQGLTLDPVQQAWNIVTSDQLHQHQQQQLHQHTTQQQQQQRTFVNVNPSSLAAFGQHLGVVIPSHSGPGFKIQHYHPHAQQQPQQQQQHAQNLNIIRNPNPLAGQGGPFTPAQFHDPNFRTFPN